MTKIQTYPIGSPVYDQALALLRSALWGEGRFPYQAPRDEEWDEIVRELKNQAVQFLTIDLLIRERPNKADAYFAAAARAMTRQGNIMRVQQDLCQRLTDAGIPCVVVKGAAAAILYPQPSNRQIGDIDLLVKPADFERACQLVEQDGKVRGKTSRHTEYVQDGVAIELHRSFSVLHDLEKRALLDQRIFDAIDAAETAWLDEYSFPQLPLLEHGLVLLEHISMHLEEGLGLRQILDWLMLADKALDDECWNTQFGPMTRKVGLETLAVTATRMCQMYLGLRTDITWCADADEALCRELMEYVLNQGNFGRKLQSGANMAVSVIGATRDLRLLFRILQDRGCINWKAARRYPFLRPFAWLYQLVRYIVKGLSNKHPLQYLRTVVKRSRTQDDFLAALGVRRKSEGYKEP